MTVNGNFKKRVRARSAKTGEFYTSALRRLRQSGGQTYSDASVFRLAVAQTTLRNDPSNADEPRRSGRDIRRMMREASSHGAHLIHLPEGATSSPTKRSLSGPDSISPSNWSLVDWETLRHELQAIAQLAHDLCLWTVLGSVHSLTPPNRPHNSLYVISDAGKVATRYDERMLSKSKLTLMYPPGTVPVTFDVDGVRFGCTSGMEVHYAELFAEYERLDVDCVSFRPRGTLPTQLFSQRRLAVMRSQTAIG